MHIFVDWDTAAPRQNTCVLDFVIAVLVTGAISVYVLSSALVLYKGWRGNLDLRFKGVFWVLVMCSSAVVHMCVIFLSNGHFAGTNALLAWHCELFDIWINILAFGLWYCFFAVFYISTLAKNALYHPTSPTAPSSFRHIPTDPGRHERDDGFELVLDDEQEVADDAPRHTPRGNAPIVRSLRVTPWTPAGLRNIKVLVATCVMLPPFVLCVVGEAFDQSSVQGAQECMMHTTFRTVVIGVLLSYVVVMWVMYCMVRAWNRIPSVNDREFLCAGVAMTVAVALVVPSNVLGITAFCVGRAFYTTVFVALYLATLYFTVLRGLWHERARNAAVRAALSTFQQHSFSDIVTHDGDEEECRRVLWTFVEWMQCAPLHVASTCVCLTRDPASCKVVGEEEMVSDHVREIAPCYTTGRFVLVPSELATLYQTVLSRKASLYYVVMHDVIQSVNELVLRQIGYVSAQASVSACDAYAQAHGAHKLWSDIHDPSIRRSTIPFSVEWRRTLACRAETNAQEPALFDDAQEFLERLFESVFYPRFRNNCVIRSQARQNEVTARAVFGDSPPPSDDLNTADDGVFCLSDPFETHVYDEV